MEDHPWIGRVRWQNRINSLCFVGCLSFIETEHHISARFVLRDFHKALNRCILQRPIFLSWFVRQEEKVESSWTQLLIEEIFAKGVGKPLILANPR